MMNFIRLFALFFAINSLLLRAIATPSPVWAGESANFTLLDIVWEELPEQYLIHLKTSGKPNYSLHELFRPLRVVIELADSTIGPMKLPMDIPRGPVTLIENGVQENHPAAKGLDIVLHLNEELVYSVDPAGNGLVLRFPRKADSLRDAPTETPKKKNTEAVPAILSAAALLNGQGKPAGKEIKATKTTKDHKTMETKPASAETQGTAAGNQATSETKTTKEKEEATKNVQDAAVPAVQVIPDILDENPVVEKLEETAAQETPPVASLEQSAPAKKNSKDKERKATKMDIVPTKPKEEKPPAPLPSQVLPAAAAKTAEVPAAKQEHPEPAPKAGQAQASKTEVAKKAENTEEHPAPKDKASVAAAPSPERAAIGNKKASGKKARKTRTKAAPSPPATSKMAHSEAATPPPAPAGGQESKARAAGALIGVEVPKPPGEEGVRIRLRGGEPRAAIAPGSPGPSGSTAGSEGESMIMTPGTVFRPGR